MHRIAKAKAESIDTVRARVLELIKGKKLVGYHLPQKLADFGILDKVKSIEKSSPAKPETKSGTKPDSDSDSPPKVANPITEEEK